MKLYIKSSQEIIPVIDIIIHLDYVDEYLVATRLIEHPKNIKRSKRISDTKLQILNDVAASAKYRIENSTRLVKTKEDPPGKNKSYSYYIQFDVYDDAGNKLTPVGIKFRISNHPMHGEETSLDSGVVIIRSFELKGKNYDNSIRIIQTVDMICSELEKGNLKILDEYTY